MIAVIRIRGTVGVKKDIKETMKLLKLSKPNHCMIMPETETYLGMIKKVKELHDVVLINCADIKNFTDAAILSSIADAFVLVINEGKVKRQIIQHAVAPIEQKNIDIIGAIIANRRYVIPEVIYKFT